jgi:hypothetical protein
VALLLLFRQAPSKPDVNVSVHPAFQYLMACHE